MLSATTYPKPNGIGAPGLTRTISFKLDLSDRFNFFVLLVDVPSDTELGNMTFPETDVIINTAITPTALGDQDASREYRSL